MNWLPPEVVEYYYTVFCAYAKLCKSGCHVSSEIRDQMLTKTMRSMEGYAFRTAGMRVSQKVLDLHPNMPQAICGKKHWDAVKRAVSKLLGTSMAAKGDDALPVYIEHPRSVTMTIDSIVEQLLGEGMSLDEFTQVLLETRPVLIHRDEVKDLTVSRATLAEAEAEYHDKVSPLVTL